MNKELLKRIPEIAVRTAEKIWQLLKIVPYRFIFAVLIGASVSWLALLWAFLIGDGYSTNNVIETMMGKTSADEFQTLSPHVDIYTFFSFLAITVALGMSVLVSLLQKRKRQWLRLLMLFVLFFIAVLLSVINFGLGYPQLSKMGNFYTSSAMALIGIILVYYTFKLPVHHTLMRPIKGIIILLCIHYIVFIPLIYSLNWVMGWYEAIRISASEGTFSIGWISIIGLVFSLIVAFLLQRTLIRKGY